MSVTRRTFLGAAATTAITAATAQSKKIPVGLELYSVRLALAADLTGTVRKVAAMGYQIVEFYAPYFSWTMDQAKDVRKLLDDLGIACRSTHNGRANFRPENIQKTIDLNKTIGATFVVMASSIMSKNIDDWKKLADEITAATDTLRPAGLRGGYHNHQFEFTPIDGKRPMEVIADNTPKDFMLQFDVGTCVEVGSDPVAWINAHPGRINSLHLKDWNKENGYKVLFGEGAVPWKELLAAAAKTGGVEYYLIEQEGSRYSEFETAQRCLDSFRAMA